jgi:hypothetical protein
MKKTIFTLALFFVLGLGMLAFGVAMLTEKDVTCAGKVMSEGDSCVQYKGNVQVGANTLEEQRSSDRRYGYVGLGVGVFFIAMGGLMIRGLVVNKAKDPAA